MRAWSKRRWVATVAGAVAVLLLITAGVSEAALNYLIGQFNRINPFCHSCNRPGGGAEGDLNILVVGSDSRAGLTRQQENHLHVGHDAGQRSDTMLLLHIPAGGGKAVLVSLPRDSYVTIPAHTTSTGQQVAAQRNKLNAAFSEGGPSLTVQTVEQNTGVRIDHYIAIDFLGFVKMVDALGGVQICSSRPINDPVHYDPSTGGYVGSGLKLAAGTNTLNGARALEYVRAREFDPAQGDLGRIKRQQTFLAALMRKAESAGVLLDPPKMWSFLRAMAGSLTTDESFGQKQIVTLATRLHSMSPSNVTLMTVPLSSTAYATPVGSAVLWNPVLSKRLFTDFTNDKPITNVTGKTGGGKLTVAPSSIALRVLNATTTNGFAAKAAADLGAVGFHVSGTGNAPSGSDPAQTVVLYGPSRADSARTVAAAVPGATTREDASLGSGLELLVGSGFSGAHSVHVSSGSSSSKASSTTAASTACS